jgi:hypothetical protein
VHVWGSAALRQQDARQQASKRRSRGSRGLQTSRQQHRLGD